MIQMPCRHRMSISERVLAVAYRKMPVQAAGASGVGPRMRRRMQTETTESLLRDLLAVELGPTTSPLTLARNHQGKPTLLSADGASTMRVSLSHCGLYALAAITNLGEIGVDLEVRDPRRSIFDIAAYAFGPLERHTVASGGLRAFYRIWTLREAHAKACGVGFSILVDGRDYFPEAPDMGAWQSAIDGRPWLFSTGDLPEDHAVAVAIALQSPLNADRSWDFTPRPLP
jgi:phosphopantetheinyl transferase